MNRDYGGLELQSVSGTITLDDAPLAGAVVTFTDVDSQRMSYGKTDAQGNYTLRFDSEQMGCPPGEKIVQISTVTQIEGMGEEPELLEDEQGRPVEPEEIVPARYNTESELKATVSAAGEPYDFSLESK